MHDDNEDKDDDGIMMTMIMMRMTTTTTCVRSVALWARAQHIYGHCTTTMKTTTMTVL